MKVLLSKMVNQAVRIRLALAFALLLVLSNVAAHATDMATAATTEVTGIKTNVIAIMVIMIGIAGAFAVFKFVKRAMHG